MDTQNQIAELQRQVSDLRKALEALSGEYYRYNFTSQQEFTKYANFTGRIKVPVVSALPATAQIGELVSYSGKLYVCSAANTWVVAGTQA